MLKLGKCSFQLRHPNVSILSSTIASGHHGPDAVVHTQILSVVLGTVKCPAWPQLRLQDHETLVAHVLSVKCTKVSLVTTEHQLPVCTQQNTTAGKSSLQSLDSNLKTGTQWLLAPFRLSRCCCWDLGSLASIESHFVLFEMLYVFLLSL